MHQEIKAGIRAPELGRQAIHDGLFNYDRSRFGDAGYGKSNQGRKGVNVETGSSIPHARLYPTEIQGRTLFKGGLKRVLHCFIFINFKFSQPSGFTACF